MGIPFAKQLISNGHLYFSTVNNRFDCSSFGADDRVSIHEMKCSLVSIVVSTIALKQKQILREPYIAVIYRIFVRERSSCCVSSLKAVYSTLRASI